MEAAAGTKIYLVMCDEQYGDEIAASGDIDVRAVCAYRDRKAAEFKCETENFNLPGSHWYVEEISLYD